MSPSRRATSRWPGGSSPSSRDRLPEEQRIDDALAELGELAKQPEANIIKLPNISRLDPAAQGGDRRAAGAGLRPAGLPGRPEDRRGEGRPRPLRQGQGQRRQPGAARGQLRPPRARVGEAVRPQPPALDGRLEPRLEDQRRAHGRPTTSAPTRSRPSSRRTASLRIELVGDDGTTTVLRESVPVLAGEVVDATVMHVAALREFLTAQIAAGQGRGRAVLGAPQGDDDEGLRPDHLRPRRAGVLPGRVRRVRRGARRGRPQPQRRARRASSRASSRCRRRAEIKAAVRRRASPTARRWRWSTPTRASPTCTCRATSSSTPRCRR